MNTEPMKPDYNRIIYEGWTAKDFIAELAIQVETVMRGESWREPFRTKKELAEWCRENQPYYKKAIPEVNDYFARMYNLK